jgi:hypothetical protein
MREELLLVLLATLPALNAIQLGQQLLQRKLQGRQTFIRVTAGGGGGGCKLIFLSISKITSG